MVNLNKAENKKINLTKAAPGLDQITVQMWWNAEMDLDISAFIMKNTPNGPKLLSDDYFVFFNQESSPEGAVTKTKDERAGGVEELYVTLSKLPAEADEVSLVVTIDKAHVKGHFFSAIPEAGVKISNKETGEDIAFFDLDKDGGNSISLQIGSFYREADGWHFQAVGAFFDVILDDFYAGYSS